MNTDASGRILLEEIDESAPGMPVTSRRTELEPLTEEESRLIGAQIPGESVFPRGGRSRTVLSGLVLGATLVLLQTLAALADLVRESPVLGVAWSAVFVLLAASAGRAAWNMLRKTACARKQDVLRRRARELLSGNGLCEARSLCEQLAAGAGQSGDPRVLRWRQQLQETHNDREVLQLYARTVLVDADAKALASVSRHAGDVAVMVAVSRFPAVDMLLVLWRQLKLVEDVATAYGVDPGYWGRIRLVRKVLRNMALAGAAEVVSEVGSDVLGAGVVSRLSAAAAQGVAAGILTARLGLRAMDACRAIPWEASERPGLRHVSGSVVDAARKYLTTSRDDHEASP